MNKKLKQFIRSCIPPVLLRSNDKGSEIYPTFDAALKHCGLGYCEADLANAVVSKNIRLRESYSADTKKLDLASLRTILGIALAVERELNVLDFGGGGGTHHLTARAIFGDRIKFRWNVVETPAMVAEAKRIESDDLQFFSDIEKAAANLGKIDLVFTSGALQYVLNPLETLNNLLSLKSKHVFITRVGLSDESAKTIIQESWLSSNGPGPLPPGVQDRKIRYPVTFANKEEFERILSADYAINAIFNEERSAYRAGAEVVNMYGYYATLKQH